MNNARQQKQTLKQQQCGKKIKQTKKIESQKKKRAHMHLVVALPHLLCRESGAPPFMPCQFPPVGMTLPTHWQYRAHSLPATTSHSSASQHET